MTYSPWSSLITLSLLFLYPSTAFSPGLQWRADDW
jgi:hypothetical protein